MKLGNNSRGRREDKFDVVIPDSISEGGAGDRPDGTKVHGSYKQPWVEHDPVKPDPTSSVDGDGKDVG
jgi:hypothetical protein